MSLRNTKIHLVQLLADVENKVVALSGKWGTGKSHLWREVKTESGDEKVKSALYVSLFGLSSIDEVKLKIVQNAIPVAEEHSAWWKNALKGWGRASKLLESFNKGFAALNEIALLAVPSILKDRVIVLDDIERKHDKLSVDEVMGFIDEFTQQHGARFILILNSDQLTDRVLWDTFREKIIDQEISLITSPAEAFDIALTRVSSPYSDHIRNTLEICGIINIRVVRKVIRAVNRILVDRSHLSDNVLSRVIPSTALLAAIHYKGIEDGPDFDFVLQVGTANDFQDIDKKADDLDELGKRRAMWRLKLKELKIFGCDEYEMVVVDFLKSGLFDVDDVAKIIDRYVAEAEEMRAISESRSFHEHVVWGHHLPEKELIAEAQLLVDKCHYLNAFDVTSLHDLVLELPGGDSIAKEIIDRWIEGYWARKLPASEFSNFFGRKVHPLLQAQFDASKAHLQAQTTVYDACEWVVKKGGWGHEQEAVLRSASVQDFEMTIRSIDTEQLKLFMYRFLDMCVHHTNYERDFGEATNNFIKACRNLCSDTNPDSRRLVALIKLLFKDANLEAALEHSVSVDSEKAKDLVGS